MDTPTTDPGNLSTSESTPISLPPRSRYSSSSYRTSPQDPSTWLATRFIAMLITGLAIYLTIHWPNLIDRLNSYLAITGRRTEEVLKHCLLRPNFTQTSEEAAQTSALVATLSELQVLGREISLHKLCSDLPSRERLLSALHGYAMYEKRALDSLDKKRKSWKRVTEAQKTLATKSGVNYTAKISKVKFLIRKNGELCNKIVTHGMKYYGIPREELQWYTQVKEKEGITSGSGNKLNIGSDHSSVTQGLKHFVRDWSEAGKMEREVTFTKIIECLERLVPAVEERARLKILIPGCGVGGLVWRVAEMGFGHVVGNEWSYYMNLLQHFIASNSPSPPLGNIPEENVQQHTFYPYIDWWSHHTTNANMTRPITFPYSCSPLHRQYPLASTKISILEGDFTNLHSLISSASPSTTINPPTEAFDIIITLFFIDTAGNLLDYLQKISLYLRPGGTWINIGPLLYGSAPWVEFSLEEVISVSERGLGFEFEKLLDSGGWEGIWRGQGVEKETYDTLGNGKVVGLRAAYGIDEKGLGRNEYFAQGWVARKKEG